MDGRFAHPPEKNVVRQMFMSKNSDLEKYKLTTAQQNLYSHVQTDRSNQEGDVVLRPLYTFDHPSKKIRMREETPTLKGTSTSQQCWMRFCRRRIIVG